jgi:hypothetical protein
MRVITVIQLKEVQQGLMKMRITCISYWVKPILSEKSFSKMVSKLHLGFSKLRSKNHRLKRENLTTLSNVLMLVLKMKHLVIIVQTNSREMRRRTKIKRTKGKLALL